MDGSEADQCEAESSTGTMPAVAMLSPSHSGIADLDAGPGTATVMVEPCEEDGNQLQLHIQHVLPDQDTDTVAGTEVILVYQDVLVCGACSKQFENMVELIRHKSEHTLGTSAFKCELCQLMVSSQTELFTHYQQWHHLGDTPTLPANKDQTEEEITETDPQPTDPHPSNSVNGILVASDEVALVNGNVVTGKENSDSPVEERSQTDEEVATTNETDLKEQKRPSRSTTTRSMRGITSRKANVKANKPETADAEIEDFSFILSVQQMKGSSFNYGKAWLMCLHCDYKSHGKVALTKHMQDKHRDLLGIHQIIHIKDNEQAEDKKIMKMSTFNSLYHKEKSFQRGRALRRPTKPASSGVFPCTQCGKVFTCIRYLRKHVQIHRTERKYLCDECGKAFKSRTYLSAHRRVHKDKLFHCNQCDFTSKIPAAIHAHRQLHSQGSVLCEVCGYAYTDKSTLTKHKRVHDLTRPYACTYPECTWRFNTETMCKAHIRAHTEEGKFKCNLCGYVFRRKHHLQRHQNWMHGVGVKGKKVKNGHTDVKVGESLGADFMKVADTISRDDSCTGVKVAETLSAEHITVTDTGLVITSDLTAQQLQLAQNSLVRHELVNADSQGTTITYEAADMSALNVAYQALMQGQEVTTQDTNTILLSQDTGTADSRTILLSQGHDANSQDSRTILLSHADAGQIVFQ